MILLIAAIMISCISTALIAELFDISEENEIKKDEKTGLYCFEFDEFEPVLFEQENEIEQLESKQEWAEYQLPPKHVHFTRCPNCGANLQYKNGIAKCKYCDSEWR